MPSLNITVDKSSAVPVYRQVAKQLVHRITNGHLPSGTQLPRERDLAAETGVAAGTVGRAYEVLACRGLVEMIKGRGTFVIGAMLPPAPTPTGAGRQARAQALVRSTIDGMVRLQFSFNEIRDLVHVMLLEREDRLQNFCIAVVDCNPEALGIYEKQLLYLSKAQVRKFLLDDVRQSPDVGAMFQAFDLILTTATHHPELTGLLPAQRDKVLSAAVAPTPQTAAELDAIPRAPDPKIGVLCLSANFRDIIRRHLAARQVADERIEAAFYQAGMDLNAFLRDKTHLILPPDFPLFSQGGYGSTLVRFSETGGRVIQFDYQIERGSLLVIEEAISKLLMA
ncbi:MAG: hypothetical protein A3K19_27445 [Lentisphaerae bacterium RIFOXYB12_FULL_65_16]|nr:MAG: hypothetical protein A3K18_06290 [Lentisphaerae bacterium RIFOXYA12_64_32]OGV86447.1 MAG: hypothetical protein A3K19_27445 [Lentisphaerae bacterium RIFOXYB12_FULL_65_16]